MNPPRLQRAARTLPYLNSLTGDVYLQVLQPQLLHECGHPSVSFRDHMIIIFPHPFEFEVPLLRCFPWSRMRACKHVCIA